MSMFVVKFIVIQINGQGYGSLNKEADLTKHTIEGLTYCEHHSLILITVHTVRYTMNHLLFHGLTTMIMFMDT